MNAETFKRAEQVREDIYNLKDLINYLADTEHISLSTDCGKRSLPADMIPCLTTLLRNKLDERQKEFDCLGEPVDYKFLEDEVNKMFRKCTVNETHNNPEYRRDVLSYNIALQNVVERLHELQKGDV